MSMLSSQIDELRELADDIESRYGYPTAVKALRDAADTIWQLRDDLQRANAETLGPCSDSCNCTNGERTDLDAENAKLREQIHWLKQGDILHVLTDQEYIDQCERERLMQVSIDALDKDNAKLRELVRQMHPIAKAFLQMGVQLGCNDTLSYDWELQMRELGMEVG